MQMILMAGHILRKNQACISKVALLHLTKGNLVGGGHGDLRCCSVDVFLMR